MITALLWITIFGGILRTLLLIANYEDDQALAWFVFTMILCATTFLVR